MDKISAVGRPRIRSDEEILHAALEAFAASGYEGMSVRTVSANLGLSHETVNRRFGSKKDLYFAALDFGFTGLFDAIATERARGPAELDDLAELREAIRTFMVAATTHPALGRILQQEGMVPSERLAYIVERAFAPGMLDMIEVTQRLTTAGVIRPTSARELFFLAQAGAAPFAAQALSRTFDVIDGPLDPTTYIDHVADVIVQGLLRLPPKRSNRS
jgi:AcrR family transcriptional regulator